MRSLDISASALGLQIIGPGSPRSSELRRHGKGCPGFKKLQHLLWINGTEPALAKNLSSILGSSPMDDWLKRFPTLSTMDRETARAVTREARVLSFPPDATVFTAGLPCENYLLVAQGVVRVQLRSEMGREIVLYRVADGETCILTTACLLADEAYGAEAITETEVLAIVLERTFFMRLLGLSESFRRFVFHGHAARLTNMLLLMEEVGVQHLETRLARLLLENLEGRARPLGCRRLARELDTAQASLKLSLDDFARRGWVRLTRERVEVLDPERLKLFAENAVSDRA